METTIDGTALEGEPSELARIREDANEVFRFSEEARPQARAHDYLDERGVARDARDTAMQRVALDLVERAYEAGRRDALDSVDAVPIAAALCELGGLMVRRGGELMAEAAR